MNRPAVLHRSPYAGFTLLEMLIVLAILSLVTALALPLVQGAPERLRLVAAARRLQTVLQTARGTAIAANEDQTVTIETSSGVLGSTAAPYPAAISGIKIDLVVADVERVSPTKGGFRFFANGSSTGGTATLRLGRSSLIISVDWLTGRIRSQEGGGDAP